MLVVVDESVLKRRIGDESVMYEQLHRLAREAEKPNVNVQALPLDAQHSVFGQSFVVFGFAVDGNAITQEVVSTETMKGDFILEAERETYLRRIAFQMLADAAFDPVAFKDLIRQAA